LRGHFDDLKEAVGKIIKLKDLKWIAFCHFEADEIGGLNQWLEVAPEAKPVCGEVSAVVNISDYAIRPAKALKGGGILDIGRKKLRYIRTPHLPHGWDAGMFFEENDKTLFCSDLFHHEGDVMSLTSESLLEPFRKTMVHYEAGILMDYSPYTNKTQLLLNKLSALRPELLATNHGSSFHGDGAKELKELGGVMKELWGETEKFVLL